LEGVASCGVGKQSQLGELLRAAKLIVWDKCSMTHRKALESVDRLMRDLMDAPDALFGGKVVVLGGDFRQILPMIQGCTAGDTVMACLKRSKIGTSVTMLPLRQKMRARADQAHAAWLLTVGEGTTETLLSTCSARAVPCSCQSTCDYQTGVLYSTTLTLFFPDALTTDPNRMRRITF
jgi:hypothetical protein